MLLSQRHSRIFTVRCMRPSERHYSNILLPSYRKRPIDAGIKEKLGLEKVILPVRGIRNLTKKDMKLNSETPEITVDPQTYEVRVNGELLTCDPVDVVPMAQRYFLF